MDYTEQYVQYSDYSFENAGFKKLDFILTGINKKFDEKKCNVLEIGCGVGNISMVLASFGYDVLGVDLCQDSINEANRRKTNHQLSNIDFQHKDANELKGNQKKYDVVICSEILEHLNSPLELLELSSSLLTTEGILIITTPNGFGISELLKRIFKPIVQNPKIYRYYYQFGGNKISLQSMNFGEGGWHIQYFTKKGLYKLFNRAGFDVISEQSSNIISGIIPINLIIQKSSKLCKADLFLADQMPSFLANGWYFSLQRKQ